MNAFDAFVETLLDASDTASPFAVGAVQSFTSNGSDPPTVVVRWQGADVRAKCPRHYTPVVGHTVLMARFGPQLLIFGAY